MPAKLLIPNYETAPATKLMRPVNTVLEAVLAGDFPVDPISGRDVSDLVSRPLRYASAARSC